MTRTAQRKATAAYRKRNRARGFARVEVQVPSTDVALFRDLAERLRKAGPPAEAMRASLQSALAGPEPRTVLEMFASDLPDEIFEGAFDRVRTTSNREIDL